MAFKGRRTANSQGRRKGRITRSMTSEVEETATPPLNNELGQSGRLAFRLRFCTSSKDLICCSLDLVATRLPSTRGRCRFYLGAFRLPPPPLMWFFFHASAFL